MHDRKKEKKDPYPYISKWMKNNGLCEHGHSTYKLRRTSDGKGFVDAEFFSAACHEEIKTDLEKHIMSFIGKEKYKVHARVSPPKKKHHYMAPEFERFLWENQLIFQLEEDDVLWKKVVKLCEDKGYGHPINLNKGAVHIPDWDTYGLPFDQDGKNTLQECVGGNQDETREPSDDLVRGS